jgi:hypothetical protein
MESTYSCSSLVGVGVVEAQVELAAVLLGQPKLRQIDLAWPMCR